MNKKLVLSISLVLTAISLFSCEAPGSPVTSARKVFEQWAQMMNTPYRNAQYETLSNDGTFAVIFVAVELRTSAQANWTKMETNINCRKVGSSWSCDQYLNFTLDKSLIAGTQTAYAATATSWENQRRATGTAEAFSALATQTRISTIFNSISVHADDIGFIYGTSYWCEGDCSLEAINVTFSISNNDNESHNISLIVSLLTVYVRNSWARWEGRIDPGVTLEESVDTQCDPYCQEYNEENTTIADVQFVIEYVDGIYYP